MTALVGMVSNAAGYSAPKYVPLWELLRFSVVANLSIAAMNFSLMLNSVGFYQVLDYYCVLFRVVCILALDFTFIIVVMV